jgi:hypothetical protein
MTWRPFWVGLLAATSGRSSATATSVNVRPSTQKRQKWRARPACPVSESIGRSIGIPQLRQKGPLGSSGITKLPTAHLLRYSPDANGSATSLAFHKHAAFQRLDGVFCRRATPNRTAAVDGRGDNDWAAPSRAHTRRRWRVPGATPPVHRGLQPRGHFVCDLDPPRGTPSTITYEPLAYAVNRAPSPSCIDTTSKAHGILRGDLQFFARQRDSSHLTLFAHPAFQLNRLSLCHRGRAGSQRVLRLDSIPMMCFDLSSTNRRHHPSAFKTIGKQRADMEAYSSCRLPFGPAFERALNHNNGGI